MCGVIGFVGKSSLAASFLLQALIIADETRGSDSTGIVTYDSRKMESTIIKKALAGSEFVATGCTEFLFKNRYDLALAHNRLGTSGPVTDRNAHPFGVKTAGGHWAFGVHNGVVLETTNLAKKYQVAESPVDSEVVFRTIAKNAGKTEKDLVQIIQDVTYEISAYSDFAFLYLDTARQSIYFWRCPDRPLTVVDGRKVGLGRWLCSTTDIFKIAWGMIRGFLPPLSKTTYFEAKPYVLYRTHSHGKFEVEPIVKLKHKPYVFSISRYSARKALLLPWDEDIKEEFTI